MFLVQFNVEVERTPAVAVRTPEPRTGADTAT